jgi:orotate phosphoribosyltransferase
MPPPGSRFVLVDDVLATGATKAEAVTFLRVLDPKVRFEALLIVLDRQERTPDGSDAVGAFTQQTGVPVLPVVRLTETLDYLTQKGALAPADLARCRAYWREHGTAPAQAWAGAGR